MKESMLLLCNRVVRELFKDKVKTDLSSYLKEITMSNLNRAFVLNTLIKHETLSVRDLEKKEHFGMVTNKTHLDYLLRELMESGHIHPLAGVTPCPYTITGKGIKEGARLNAEVIGPSNSIVFKRLV